MVSFICYPLGNEVFLFCLESYCKHWAKNKINLTSQLQSPSKKLPSPHIFFNCLSLSANGISQNGWEFQWGTFCDYWLTKIVLFRFGNSSGPVMFWISESKGYEASRDLSCVVFLGNSHSLVWQRFPRYPSKHVQI